MSDLIERLRAFEIDTGSGGFEPEVCHEAADEIERLQARVEALEGVIQCAMQTTIDHRVRDVLDRAGIPLATEREVVTHYRDGTVDVEYPNADEIERLQARVEELEGVIDRALY